MIAMDVEIKQVILVRNDLGMGKGKLAAQVAHASLMSYFKASEQDKGVADRWLETGEKKIVLKANSEETLLKFFNAFEFKRIPCALVTDAGLTELPPGTKTALGVGPWKSDEIDVLTRGMQLL